MLNTQNEKELFPKVQNLSTLVKDAIDYADSGKSVKRIIFTFDNVSQTYSSNISYATAKTVLSNGNLLQAVLYLNDGINQIESDSVVNDTATDMIVFTFGNTTFLKTLKWTANSIVVEENQATWKYTDAEPDKPLTLDISSGGTGANDAAVARTNLGAAGQDEVDSQGTRLTDAEGAIDDLQTDLRYVYAPNDDITGASFNKDFLLVGTTQADQAALFNSSNLSGEFTNVPPALSGVTVASGIRRTETLAPGYVYVRVEEFYPVNGRIHTNFLEGGSTWRGWHTTDPVGITPIERGGTESNTVAGARSNLGVPEYATGTWTAHIYDLNTKVMEIPDQRFFRVGNILVMELAVRDFTPTSAISTMLQVRNLPAINVFGGNIYIANLSGNGGNTTIQNVGANWVYIRPNVTLEKGTNYGWFTGLFFGII